ncbi:MAG: DUF3667 domain-containing protein [Woeseiaceae bacterium]|nr:DUF3667 domain-containing protein [Woeseiaceae bacterium]
MKQCRNCRTSFDGAFCPSCGQKDIDLERSLSELVGELLRETLEIDGRSFRTIRALFLQPGTLTAEFLAGRRRAYSSPLRLYLVISVSFFVLAAWLAGRGVLLDSGQSIDTDALSQARFLSDDLPRLMFVLLPIFAILLKIATPRRLYFDHIIFSIHLHSFAYVVLALMLPLENVGHWLAIVIQVLLLAYLLIYFVISVRCVYDTSWTAATVKSAAVLFTYLIIFSGLIETASSLRILSD